MDVAETLHPNDRLRQERIRHNWRQQDLADHLGTTAVTVRRWERGSQQPSAHFRVKLCALFGKSAEELGLVEETLSPPTTPEREASGEILMSSSPTEKPALWTVPYRRNPYFTGRDELLHLLDQHLSAMKQGELTTTRHAALTQPHAMKGLGGIGKTQIAVEYAYRAREQGHYTHTLWINAASPEAVMTSFIALADVLPAFPAKNETDQQKLVAAIKRWLEQCSERWLLIFDNADDLSLVQEYVPSYGNGSILLTTRANAVGSFAASIDVDKMSFVEGVHLLLRRAQRLTQASDDEVNEAGNIVVALDHFPLALEQAGAYIEETGCSFENYLKLYQTHRSALLARRGAQTTNYPDSVATTWSLSFQKVEQKSPAAAELLRLCAFLAPDHIPEELLTEGAPHWPAMLQQAVADPFSFDQQLEALLAFSLVKRLAENHLLSIHRLVQAVQIDRMGPEEQRQWAERVVLAVHAIFPRDPKTEIATWPQCLRYLEQAQACDTLIQQWELTLSEGADLLESTGSYLYEHGSYALAKPLFQRAFCILEQSLGSEHPKVASPLNNLAETYREQGKYPEAEPLYQHALHIREQSLGPEHSGVAFVLSNLALLYREQGKYEQAEPLYQRALRIVEQSLEPEDPQVATIIDCLATMYKDQGKYAKAEPLYQRALHIYRQSLGPEHPFVAAPLHNLAVLYREQGKYEQAELLYRHALHIIEQSFSPEHPKRATSLTGLAGLYWTQGKYKQAEPLYQHALCIYEQSLGPEHPMVAYPLNNLAETYREQGKYTEAEPLYLRALHIREQSLGPEHPQVAYPLNNLADLYRDQGKYAEAEPLFQRALHIREQSLGREHPEVAYPLNNLAELYCIQGRYAEAEPLFQRALHLWEQSLGREHPQVAYALQGLADLYQMQGKYVEAEPLYRRVQYIWEQSLGPEHPLVAYPLGGLANTYREQGKYTEAESLYQRALYIREQALEPDHPDIAETLHGLAALREAQGNIEQSAILYRRALMIRERVYGPRHPKTTDTRERLHAVLDRMEGIATPSTRHPEHDA